MIWAGHQPGLPLTSTQQTPRPSAGAGAAAASFLPAFALGRFTATVAAVVAATAR